MGDGSFIPNFPNVATIRDRVEKFYAKRQSQFYLGDDDDDHTPVVSAAKTSAKSEDPARRKARLEYELDLKEREEALEMKQLKLEREEKRKDQNSKSARATQVVEMLQQLTDEEIASVKGVKSDFH